MDKEKELEEKLREAACFGDFEAVRQLIEQGVDVNSQHIINGWTSLHWAVKRGQRSIIEYLIRSGADPNITNCKGETPANFTEDDDIIALLKVDKPTLLKEEFKPTLPITPNYISNTPLDYKVKLDFPVNSSRPTGSSCINGYSNVKIQTSPTEDELVLKIRLANHLDQDFIEVELPNSDLTFSRLLRVCCEELAIDAKNVLKVRKLPDTIVRKDKDIKRFKNLQEIEVVLKDNSGNPLMLGSLSNISLSSQQIFQSNQMSNCKILY